MRAARLSLSPYALRAAASRARRSRSSRSSLSLLSRSSCSRSALLLYESVGGVAGGCPTIGSG